MAYTFIQSDSNNNDASGTSLPTNTLSSTTAGSLQAVFVKWEGANGSTVSVSDGTSSWTGLTVEDNAGTGNDLHSQWFYILTGNAGKTSVTATWSLARPFRRIYFFEFTYAGTCSFDTQNTAEGLSSAVNSGNITITGTDNVVLCGYGEYSLAAISARTINGVAADGFKDSGTGSSWYRILNGSTFAGGAGACTLDSGQFWNANIASFAATGGGGGGGASSEVNFNALLSDQWNHMVTVW